MRCRAADLRRLTGLVLALALACGSARAADPLTERANRGLVEIVAGSVGGTSLRMAEDLAETLDDGATRRVLPVVGKGAFQNLADLKVLRGVDLAIVQADVLDYARTQKLYANIDGFVTYIAKLNNDEFHLLARADIRGIADLAGKKVNFGTANDGTAFTGPRLFDLLKIKVEPTGYGQALALEKLRRGEIAAMAVVVGKPAPLFQSVRSQDNLHFLAVPLKGDIAASYLPARLGSEDYPDLVAAGSPVDTVAVGTVLIVAGLPPELRALSQRGEFRRGLLHPVPQAARGAASPEMAGGEPRRRAAALAPLRAGRRLDQAQWQRARRLQRRPAARHLRQVSRRAQQVERQRDAHRRAEGSALRPVPPLAGRAQELAEAATADP